MAKKNDHLADFATENTGGVLTGFLADEEQLDRRAMFRLGTWGVASVGAVIVALLANQSSLRMRNDELAAADLSRQAQQIQSTARESENETRRLASAVDTLNSDRDRVYTRLSTLEQGLDSVTGAIAKQKTAATTPAAASTSPSAANPAAPAAPAAPGVAPAPEAAAEPAPSIGSVATTLPTLPAKPAAEARRRDQPGAKVATASPAPVPAPDPVAARSSAPSMTASVPLGPTKSIMGPPDPAAPKMIEPEPAKTAAVTTPVASPSTVQPTSAPAPETTATAPVADKPAAEKSVLEKSTIEKPTAEQPTTEKPTAVAAVPEASPQLAVNRTEFGVDVGGANSIGGLRALWRGLLKSRSNAPLAALQPIIVIKESNNGLGMQLRLVAGPLTDAAAAARICAKMAENERPCTTTVYDGQRLAVNDAFGSTGTISPRTSEPSDRPDTGKSTEKPASPKSGRQSWHRHSYSRRAVVEEPPKKPEATTTSTISSFFSRR
jgi:hypothetical protein